jgi:hypothetical protein
MRAALVIFKKMIKVSNHLMGKNSPNLVTLLMSRRSFDEMIAAVRKEDILKSVQ